MSLDSKRWPDPQPAAANGCPTPARTAGAIWTAVGLFMLLAVVLDAARGGGGRLVGLAGLAVMHLYSGLRTLTGSAPGTARYGVVSAAFGLLWSAVAVTSARSALTSPTAHPYAPLLLLVIAAGGAALLAAGCLGVAGSAGYRRWRDPFAGPAGGPPPEWVAGTAARRGRAAGVPVWACAGLFLAVFLVGSAVFTKLGVRGAEVKPGATVEEYGRYRPTDRAHAAARPASGVSPLAEGAAVLLEQTDQIPCRVGELWGLRIRASGEPVNRPYTVRQEVRHPPIRQPDGSTRTTTAREMRVRAGESPDRYYGWQFLKGHEHELVPGEWTVVVFIDGVEVASRSFHVRK